MQRSVPRQRLVQDAAALAVVLVRVAGDALLEHDLTSEVLRDLTWDEPRRAAARGLEVLPQPACYHADEGCR